MQKFAVLASVLLICLFLPAIATALSQEEWDQECRVKTSGTATLYAIERDPNATDVALSVQLIEAGSLPEGTYVKTGEFDYDLNMWQIAYLKDGSQYEAWVEKSAIVDATTVVYFDDGSCDALPEAMVADIDALLRRMNTVYPDRLYSAIPGSSTVHVEQVRPVATPQPVKDPNTDTSGKVKGEWNPSQTASEEELAFNAECPWRLKRTINGYSDPHMTQKYEAINIGTYCMIVTSFSDVVKIAYYKNGEEHAAHIERADLLGTTTQYVNADGLPDGIRQADPNYDAVVGSHEVTWLAESIRQDLDTQVEAERNADGKEKKSSAPAKGQKSGASAKDNGNGKIKLKELGTYTSKVSYQGKTLEVRTAELSLGKDVPEDKKLAVIYTPRTGKASLRRSASLKADMLKQCKAGTLVIVLEYGETYSLINYKNTAGYILNECLQFHGAASKAEGKGKLGYKGKVSGGTTVNIRLEADGGSRRIGEFRTGTEVTIIKYGDEWCEIEVGGLRGFVMTEFLVKN
jgi:hypothetical protein